MTGDSSPAFDSLQARAAASAGRHPLDRISLRDHIVNVEIGAFQPERGVSQRLSFDVVVEVAPPRQDLADDVDQIMSYDALTQAISASLAEQRLNLLETLAERICARILYQPQAVRVFLRIQKLDRGPGALGVEVVRTASRGDTPADVAAGPAPQPLVVFFANAAVASDNLDGWMSALLAAPEPVVICLDIPGPVPVATDPAAQRRIDLLAMEQAGWAFCARLPDCAVVASRTELDWRMRQGRVSIWAPSQMVLGAVPPPASVQVAPLVAWFAGLMNASELICIGAPVPPGSPVPARAVALEQADVF
jgi:7,8-dihydroneopterin aldolase/epimerase/oxygenase